MYADDQFSFNMRHGALWDGLLDLLGRIDPVSFMSLLPRLAPSLLHKFEVGSAMLELDPEY